MVKSYYEVINMRSDISVYGKSPLFPHVQALGLLPSESHPCVNNEPRDTCVIHYILEGKGIFRGISLEKGQGFLICPGEIDAHRADAEAPWRYFYISFEKQGTENLLPLLRCNEKGIFSFAFARSLEKLIDEYTLRGCTALAALEAQSILLRILAMHTENETNNILPLPEIHVANIKAYFDTYYMHPVTVMTAAQCEHIDAQYVYNIFMKYAGISPKNYLSEVRLRHAKRLLRESNLSVEEVGLAVGYTDGLQFSKFFSRKMKISPSAFRKTMTAHGDDI